jgi:5'-nucleotidase
MTLFLLAAIACAPRHAEEGLPATPGRVTILHTNDIHGHFLPEAAEWLDGRPAIGGFARLDAEMDSLRAARPAHSVLTLDGGDQLTGTPITDLVVDGSKGGAMHRFYELLGYDAWAVGNHEFDKGLDNLSAYTKSHPIHALSANLRAPDGVSPLLPNQQSSEIFVRSGVRIGVIGVTTDQLAGLMNRKDFARLKLLKVEDAVRAEVARLDPLTDVIVVLSHVGVDGDEALARYVPGIDLIVGGHSHTRLTEARHVGETWVVQAGSYNREVGVIDMAVADDHIADFHYTLHDLLPETAPGPASPEVTALADQYQAQIDAMYGEKLSDAPALLGRDYHHDNALGRWITDVLRITAGTDIGMYNGGGLRADIPAGPVTRGTIYACFPFGNELTTFELTGEELQQVVLRNVIAENDEKRGYLSLSGVSWTWRMRNGAPELVDVKVGASALDLKHTYTVATNNYVAEQWDKHLGVEPHNVEGQGMTDFEAAVQYAAAHGPVVDPGDVRAKRVE